jgi:hypothetical protein
MALPPRGRHAMMEAVTSEQVVVMGDMHVVVVVPPAVLVCYEACSELF